MKLIACLGNPGKKYTYTRHNIGFLVGEYLANTYSISINKTQFNAELGRGSIGGVETMLLFPQTYMNRSGDSVSAAMNFFKIDKDDLIVVHDELELAFGDIRTKQGGGHKGHNGIRSIIDRTGTPDFNRLRFGIGRPQNENVPVATHVLTEFTQEEKSKLDTLYEKVDSLISELF